MSRIAEIRPMLPRLLMGAGGLTLIGIGLIEALELDVVDLLWLAFWLAAGVFIHDGVLSPAIAVLSKALARRVSPQPRRSLLVAMVCIASLTLIALPLMGRQGAVAGNDTLLGRNYLAGWAWACLLVLVGAGLTEVYRRIRAGLDRRDGRDRSRATRDRDAAAREIR